MRAPNLVALLMIVSACGDPEGVTLVDAPPDDAPDPIDAPTDAIDAPADAPSPVGTVTVSVRDFTGAAPDDGAMVHFTRADGTFMSSVATDAAGNASGEVEDGGMVTVEFTAVTSPISIRPFQTVGGVRIGDHLEFGGRVATTTLGTVTVEFPALAGSTAYTLEGPCLMGSSPATTPSIAGTLVAGCTAPYDITIRTTIGGAIQYLHATDVTPQVGTTLTLSGTWAAATRPTATLVGAPAVTTLAAQVRRILGHHDAGMGVSAMITPGDPATLRWPHPDGYDGALKFEVRYETDDEVSTEVFLNPAPAEPTIDVTRRVPQVFVQPDGNGLRWTLSGGTAVDTIRVLGIGSDVLWTVVLPPTSDRLVKPQFPGVPDVTFGQARVVDVDVVTSYDEVRPRAGILLGRGYPEVPDTLPAAVNLQTAFGSL
jgi:hypothetical protein